MMMRKLGAVALALTTMITLAACGSADPSNGSDTKSAAAKSTPAVKVNQMGEPVTNGGATVTVNKIEEAATLMFDQDGWKKGFKPQVESRPQNAGAKFVKVSTTVKNDGQESMDLTCGYAVGAKLQSADKKMIDPMRKLYLVPENPECNTQTNPGFASEMAWVFEVPESFDVNGAQFAFFDPKVNYDKPSFVSLKK